jgi:hypothetical protein
MFTMCPLNELAGDGICQGSSYINIKIKIQRKRRSEGQVPIESCNVSYYSENYQVTARSQFSFAPRTRANGPAIKGGCVTRRQHRAGSWYFSQESVTVQGGYDALFAVQVQGWLSFTRVAVQI